MIGVTNTEPHYDATSLNTTSWLTHECQVGGLKDLQSFCSSEWPRGITSNKPFFAFHRVHACMQCCQKPSSANGLNFSQTTSHDRSCHGHRRLCTHWLFPLPNRSLACSSLVAWHMPSQDSCDSNAQHTILPWCLSTREFTMNPLLFQIDWELAWEVFSATIEP